MSKISKFIFIPILALLLCYSIIIVGCSNKNNSSNNSNNSNNSSNNNNNNNVTPPQNINYFQELGNYIKKNGKYIDAKQCYKFQYAPLNSSSEEEVFYGELDYYPDTEFKLMGFDNNNKTLVEFQISELTDYANHKYTVNGAVRSSYDFTISFTAENATVPFDSHKFPTDDAAKFQQYVEMAQNIINTTIQSFSSYFSKTILTSSDKMAYAKAFHLPTKVTITNKAQN